MNTIQYFFLNLFGTDDFPARWFCGKWSDFHGWLYIISNLVVWMSYFAIPISLIYFVIKRDDLPMKRVFVLFIFFILFCGTTHFIDAIIFWVPVYRLNAVMLFFTAVVSSITAFTMFSEIPKAAQLKSPQQLQKIIDQRTQELQEANIELKKSREIFKKLVDNNPDVISRLDEDYKYLFVNKSVNTYSDLDPEFYVGKTHEELSYPEPTRDFLERNIDKSLGAKQIIKEKLVAVDQKNIKRVHEVVFVPLDNAYEEKKEIITIARDITKEEEAKEALDEKIAQLNEQSETLRRQYQQLEEFSYIVSHNLRSPAGNLTALYQIIDEEDDPDTKAMYFENAKKVAFNLKQTIEDLTEVITIKLAKDYEYAEVSLSDTLQKVKDSLKNEITVKDAEIKADFKVSKVNFNKVYLESILQNLLTNGLKYADPKRKPKVLFTSEKAAEGVQINYNDNGLGLDMAKHGEKLFKLNKTFHGNKDARGVGLFITKNQIESYGGSITAKSEEGNGMEFSIFLPDQNLDNG